MIAARRNAIRRHGKPRSGGCAPIAWGLWCTALAIAPGSVLPDYQAGLDAYQRGDHATALAEWSRIARQPPETAGLPVHREALYGLAMLYWNGEGVRQDFGAAAVWLRQAADINHAGAQNKLGFLYATGQGVPRNLAQAERWLRMAAEQGDPDAMHNLERLLSGDGLDGLPPSGPGHDGAEPARLPDGSARAHDLDEAGGGAAAAAPAGRLAADRRWILEQPPEHYTIQVIALRRPDKLYAFIADHPDWMPLALYRPAGNPAPLWVLVQGSYPDVESAREAAGRFPRDLQGSGEPWIRRFAMVQGLIE